MITKIKNEKEKQLTILDANLSELDSSEDEDFIPDKKAIIKSEKELIK